MGDESGHAPGSADPPRLADLADRQFEALRVALANRRRALGLSMSDLARQVGVSPSMISQIERGQSLPSVATLFALAAALGATVDAFFSAPMGVEEIVPPVPRGAAREAVAPRGADAGTEQRYVVRAGQRAGIDIQGGVRWERLTPMSLNGIEFLELIYGPGAESNPSPYRHLGIEMVVVLEGRLDISVGFESYTLLAGDSILFESSIPHRYVNPTDHVARAVTTILRDVHLETGPNSASAASETGREPATDG